MKRNAILDGRDILVVRCLTHAETISVPCVFNGNYFGQCTVGKSYKEKDNPSIATIVDYTIMNMPHTELIFMALKKKLLLSDNFRPIGRCMVGAMILGIVFQLFI